MDHRSHGLAVDVLFVTHLATVNDGPGGRRASAAAFSRRRQVDVAFAQCSGLEDVALSKAALSWVGRQEQ